MRIVSFNDEEVIILTLLSVILSLPDIRTAHLNCYHLAALLIITSLLQQKTPHGNAVDI